MNLFPFIVTLDPDKTPMAKFTRALMAVGVLTMGAQLWAWQRGLNNIVT